MYKRQKWVRLRRRTVQLSYVVLLLLFTVWPTEMTFLLLFGIIAAREIIELIFDQEEPTYWRRHQEWKKRVREVTFRQGFVDWVEPRRDGDPGACELVQIVAPEGSANSPASSCLMNAAESDSQNGDEAGAREDAAEVVRADEEEEDDDDEPLPPAYSRAPAPPTAPSFASSRRALRNALELRDVASDTRRALDAAVAARLPRPAVDALRDRLRADEAAATAAAAAADAEAQAADATAEAATAEPVDTQMSTADGDGRVLARADLSEAAAAGDAAAEAHDVDEARDVQIELAQVGEKFFREIS